MATSTMTYEMFQKQITEWTAKNFGKFRGWHQPFSGIVEEMGELFDSFDKGNYEETEDAIADMMIYIGDLCGLREWNLNKIKTDFLLSTVGEELLSSRRYNDISFHLRSFARLGSWVGKLGHALLKQEQGIRGSFEDHEIDAQKAITQITSHLDLICKRHGWSRDELTFDTWERVVSNRDWTSNPEDGVS